MRDGRGGGRACHQQAAAGSRVLGDTAGASATTRSDTIFGASSVATALSNGWPLSAVQQWQLALRAGSSAGAWWQHESSGRNRTSSDEQHAVLLEVAVTSVATAARPYAQAD